LNVKRRDHRAPCTTRLVDGHYTEPEWELNVDDVDLSEKARERRAVGARHGELHFAHGPKRKLETR
jgi:hypothetical protein